jgi:UDPglucose 6-dehydrogenase
MNETKIGVIGLGYVGLATSLSLAEAGYKIIGIDVDREKIRVLSGGKSPIYEPGFDSLLKKNKKRLDFSEDYAALEGAEVIFLSVPTPDKGGKVDLRYVFDASARVAEANKDSILAIKSTVAPGTAKTVNRKTGMRIVSNPEFLREGSAIHDTTHPDRIVIGGSSDAAIEVAGIWSFTNAPVLITTNENAELIKYASNAFLATKISFINEIANLCESIPDTDVEVVAKGMGYDKRIAPYFLKAGLGWGGSCFPKDTKALVGIAREHGKRMKIVEAAISVNEERIEESVRKICGMIGSIPGKTISILGLAFKDETGDTRDSMSLKLIRELKKEGAEIKAYDPKVTSCPEVKICGSIDECMRNTDCVVIASEWKDFILLENSDASSPIVDLRRVLNKEKFKSRMFSATGLGAPHGKN